MGIMQVLVAVIFILIFIAILPALLAILIPIIIIIVCFIFYLRYKANKMVNDYDEQPYYTDSSNTSSHSDPNVFDVEFTEKEETDE